MTLNVFAEIELHPHVNRVSYAIVHDEDYLEKHVGT